MSIYHPTISPKEKAEELRKQYLFLLYEQSGISVGAFIGHTATKCAKLAVEQMIDIWGIFDGPQGSTYSNPGKYYWWQVKKELEKML